MSIHSVTTAASACVSVLLLSALITGCANYPRQPDNRQWHAISCSTFLQPANMCHREALAICPKGYDIYNPIYSPGEQLRKLEIACR